MSSNSKSKLFSHKLENWLNSDNSKTFFGLGEVFGEKSIAIIIMLLMAVPALPIPTGGVTHLFEIVCMLLSLELIIGRKSLWLPKRWNNLKLSDSMQKKAIPKLISFIRWTEKFARPRSTWIFGLTSFTSLLGILILIFVLIAFFAPPFSGLDTLPSIGVVLICLSMLIEDALLLLIGLLIGSLGFVVVIGLGKLIVNLIG